MKNYWLYVLKLEQGKYYVGVTSKTPEIRMKQHQNGFGGAGWARKYKPIALFDSKQLGVMSLEEAEHYENKVVREYIKKYGIDNVRGGDLSYSGNLIKRFGKYFDAEEWKLGALAIFAMLCLFLAFLLK
ncbi:MAG: GIY-YIG nuclease family protein [Candidatus Saccharimonadales bacterium]